MGVRSSFCEILINGPCCSPTILVYLYSRIYSHAYSAHTGCYINQGCGFQMDGVYGLGFREFGFRISGLGFRA